MEELTKLYNIGDEVEIIGSDGSEFVIGSKGTIVHINELGWYGIEFTFKSSRFGHACGMHCKNGYGRYFYPNHITKVYKTSPQSEIINNYQIY
jgi:hypothetical protein